MLRVQESLPYGLSKQVLQRDWRMPHDVQEAKVRANQKRTFERVAVPQVLMCEFGYGL